jgi:hypothetical protein
MVAFGIRRLQGPQTFGGILLFGLLAMTARNAVDPDLWWHLRTGQWIAETRHIPLSDPFSFTRAGHTWVSHEWLSEVTFYELWKQGGAAALIVFCALVTTAGFMLLYFRCPGKRHWAAAMTAIAALASAPTWGVRPQMFTFTLASLLLWLLEAGETKPKLLFWVPPLFLLWLNLHAGFALGPALLVAYALGLITENALGNSSWLQVRPLLLRVLLLLGACLALIPLNPSGAQLYRYPFDTLRSAGMRSFISEWFSPDFHQLLYRPLLVVWILLFIALATRSRPKGRVMIPLLFTAFASLDAARHIPIFVLVAIPVIAALPFTSAPFRGENQRLAFPSRPLFNAAIIILIAVFASVKLGVIIRSQGAREGEIYPQAAVASLRSAGHVKRLFAYYDWGGYAIWRLYPDYQVFVDGRADLYGDALLSQFKTAIQLHNGWREVLDRWRVEAVLVPPGCALAQALLIDPQWQTAFSDSKALILRRPEEGRKRSPVSPNSALGKDSVTSAKK